jgi:4-hydroxybenzoate polyprenyltransferase
VELVRALRPHHWVKNLLVFLPVLAARSLSDPIALTGAFVAFASFCLISSAIYLVNDLHDLADDRRHPHKSRRPLAAGRIAPRTALVVALLLGLAALALALMAAPDTALFLVVAIYGVLAIGYSSVIKTVPFLDLLCLAAFYVLRVVAGGVASGETPSTWLIGFSLVLFLSLASAKRSSELVELHRSGGDGLGRRNYRASHGSVVVVVGRASGVIAVAVLAAYGFSPAAADIHSRPTLIAAVAGMLALWLARLWGQVAAGQMRGDPIIFAMRDRASLVIAGTIAVTYLLAGS